MRGGGDDIGRAGGGASGGVGRTSMITVPESRCDTTEPRLLDDAAGDSRGLSPRRSESVDDAAATTTTGGGIGAAGGASMLYLCPRGAL